MSYYNETELESITRLCRERDSARSELTSCQENLRIALSKLEIWKSAAMAGSNEITEIRNLFKSETEEHRDLIRCLATYFFSRLDYRKLDDQDKSLFDQLEARVRMIDFSRTSEDVLDIMAGCGPE